MDLCGKILGPRKPESEDQERGRGLGWGQTGGTEEPGSFEFGLQTRPVISFLDPGSVGVQLLRLPSPCRVSV